MPEPTYRQPDPKLDLLLERVVDVPVELVWAAWTKPEQVVKWFTPAPWSTASCEIDLRPGGSFKAVMRSPEGQEYLNEGCYLEILPNERLVWTNALAPGYRPVKTDTNPEGLIFTGVITMEPQGSGTNYRALVMHADEATCKRHEGMGFHHGWGAALDQLVASVKSQMRPTLNH